MKDCYDICLYLEEGTEESLFIHVKVWNNCDSPKQIEL